MFEKIKPMTEGAGSREEASRGCGGLSGAQRAGLFLQRNACAITFAVLAALAVFCASGRPAFAASLEDDAETVAMWNAVMVFMSQWVRRLGIVVVFIGVIMFGLSFRSDNPDQRTSGVYVMIAGAIVAAATVLVNQFLVI